MFNKIEARIPVVVNGAPAQRGTLEVDFQQHVTTIELENSVAVSRILRDMLAEDHYIMVKLQFEHVNGPRTPLELTDNEMELVEALTTTGISESEAVTWVRALITNRM